MRAIGLKGVMTEMREMQIIKNVVLQCVRVSDTNVLFYSRGYNYVWVVRSAHKHAYYMMAIKFNVLKGQDDIRTLQLARVNRKIEFV